MPGKPRRGRNDEGAQRCSICGISFPPYIMVCRACDEETDYIGNIKPDEDWGEQAAAIRAMREGPTQLAMRKTDEDGICRVQGRVHVHEGQYFITIGDVVASGYYEPLDTFDLIEIGKHTFEVVGLYDGLKAYLVRYFTMGITDEDMAWLAHE